MRDVRLKGVEVGNLGASKVGPDHGTTPLPRRTICIEDAMAKNGYESASSSRSQTVVLEVGRQNSLHILGFNGGYNYQESVESATLFVFRPHPIIQFVRSKRNCTVLWPFMKNLCRIAWLDLSSLPADTISLMRSMPSVLPRMPLWGYWYVGWQPCSLIILRRLAPVVSS
jgi:hypothetical protein